MKIVMLIGRAEAFVRRGTMFGCAAVALAATCASGYGQSVDLSGIAHVAFRVSDIAKTSDFYQSLGFVQAFAMSKDGATSQAFVKINDRQFIELYPQTTKDSTLGFMHLCFEGSDLNQLNAAYLQRGLDPTAVRKAHAGNLLFTMVGPEDQNIEYTEYMPGSLHSNDRSKHLGRHRISERMMAVDLSMRNPNAAASFYIDKLSFQPVGADRMVLLLPGASGEAVEFKPSEDTAAPDIVFEVRDLKRTARRLRERGLAVTVERGGVMVRDPDGNPIEFALAPQR